AVVGSPRSRACSRHASAARCHRRPLARRPRARRHRDSGLGRDFLSAGLDCAADRSRTRLVGDLCHGWLFARVAHGGGGFAARRGGDSPARRGSPPAPPAAPFLPPAPPLPPRRSPPPLPPR